MKKVMKWTVILAAIVVLGACGSGKTTGSSAAKESSSAETAGKLAAIKKAGVIRVGTSADFPPFEFHAMVDGTDQIVGADVDMVNAIAEELGVKVKWSDTDFDTMLASLQAGNLDMGVSGISATEERKENMLFTENYYIPKQNVVINKQNMDKYTDIADFKEKKVGAQKGSIQEGIVQSQFADSQLVAIAKIPNLVMEVKSGSLDGLVLEDKIAASYVAQNDDLAIADVEVKSTDDESYSIALPKGSEDLQAELNTILKKLIAEGKIDEFVEKNDKLANDKAK
ncbi:transporter substrate-binding domain-containing protein [Candidatus Enterococcus leclercqii]|uniref:transporter substrate-binding domain-containing protein n=1 Tax=Candidatus Enterococcus leclercqii TaxID=1857218 RepID=UPI00137AAC7B|nr:transporter substrate-binding domain-containing protein [Enterococcus sp. CU9D]KAF1290296.1 amino acid ABC transporter substrate-binding protein [Enterococcus sp. CU9D]